MNYIIYSDGRFDVCVNGKSIESDCKMITHYKRANEELRKSHEWKSGTEPVFAESYMMPYKADFFEPRVNGITSVGGDYFYYSLELEKGGGIYKKSKTAPEDEAFIFTSNDIVPQHLHAVGSRLACSLKYPDGTSHIAMFVSERPDYYEFTGGDSVDEHPFIYNGKIFFDSAGVRRGDNGEMTLGNRGISVYDIESKTVTDLFYSEDYEYILPRISTNGDLYCIRRPRKKETSVGGLLIGIITAPFWIFAAVVGFLSAFVRIFTGKQLLGKNNRDSVKESAKEIIDGCDIDIEREEKRNAKNGERYPGYAPSDWELIRIKDVDGIMSVERTSELLNKAERLCRGVIGYELTDNNAAVISNGNCLVFRDGKRSELVSQKISINRNFTVTDI